MIEKLVENQMIVNEATEQDWLMHASTKPTHIVGKFNLTKTLVTLLENNTEYIVVYDYETEYESEFSIIMKYENTYYFVTDTTKVTK